MDSILFVCLGNICRSPAAEEIFRHKAALAGLDVFVDSAGLLDANRGSMPDSRMISHCRQRGYELTSRSRPVEPEDFDNFDMVVAMDDDNVRGLKLIAATPEHEAKIHKMTDFAVALNFDHVPDPYYGGDYSFIGVVNILEDACGGLVTHLKTRMAKKGVIFDMDGVLVDNTQAHIDAYDVYTARKGIVMDEGPHVLLPFFGQGNRGVLEALYKRRLTDREVEEMANEKEAIYREMYGPVMVPMPGLLDLLKELRARGVRIAVGSSAILRNVDFVLDTLSIREYFDAIVAQEMVAEAKPAPDIFLLAAEKLGLTPSECVVIEDSFSGIKAARRAGMKVAVLTTTQTLDEHKDYDLIAADFTGISVDDLLR